MTRREQLELELIRLPCSNPFKIWNRKIQSQNIDITWFYWKTVRCAVGDPRVVLSYYENPEDETFVSYVFELEKGDNSVVADITQLVQALLTRKKAKRISAHS